MPNFFGAGCGRDGAAASRFCGNLSQLSTLSSAIVFGFSIAGGDTLPERLSSLLGVLHLFTLLGMSVVILCNVPNLDIKKSKQISTAESAST